MASQSGVLRAAVSYQKLPGTLSIDSRHLSWAPSSSSSSGSSLHVLLTHIVGLSVSKAGASTTAMGIALSPDTPGAGGKTKVMLYFTPDTNGDAVSATVSGKSSRAAASPATGQSSTPNNKAKNRVTELDLRYSVLRANPQLASLHRDLVMSGELKDAEFWDHPTRKALLSAERAAAEQTSGRNARIADPRPRTDERGEMRVEITPQLKRDLFEQYPVVRRAWEENVPKVMDEAAFWTRYFQSRLYHRLRTSARSAANAHIFREDDIFDKYLEQNEDDQIEPRKEHNAHDALLDLGATAEDHQETGNLADYTMRGGTKTALPLLRRFNEHSASLLDDALGAQEDVEGNKRRKIGVDQDYGGATHGRYWDSIHMMDLDEEGEARGIPLDLTRQKEMFEKRARGTTDLGPDALTDEQLQAALHSCLTALPSVLNHKLGDFKPTSSAGGMKVMLNSIKAKSAARASSRAEIVPDAILKSVMSHQAAVNEFLRQYWAALSQQPARAARMLAAIGRLREQGLKVEREAEAALPGQGSERVRMLMAPTLQAVTRAMSISSKSSA
ncbi:RNA polymerase II transcription initiation/nucleotide excision repair factor TFIIH, subunit TFB1 [Ceraceosorus bombacis]|uniref:RNA polymerase II transcription initiation/nucleotide excision repair factor TFIIH, subunit TFB1 n=1 Tax=Ceraceosorus bombacis TaxID=401625 RepID=A0A0P1BI27_9BASI|nr:RNA polymerase II transcription initiation/nucleotide excision repair factor TFIIH, subunit TFB1 [Ceraceosorus bombacis]